MRPSVIGIHDLSIYLPLPRLDLSVLEAARANETPTLGRHLQRALRVTGQTALRFPSAKEDTATLAAEAAARLLERTGDIVRRAPLRYVVAGTETGLDHSKPLSAWVQGMLSGAGFDPGNGISSFQVQHACAGASLAMVSIASLLRNESGPDQSGLVVASDVARYETSTTAEITQGAGAAAVLLGRDPGLLEIDLGAMGFYSSDADDFFRPFESVTARVNGRHSMDCYKTALRYALQDYAERSGSTPAEVLDDHDAFVLHAPFKRMPEEAMTDVLIREMGLNSDEAIEYLSAKCVDEGVEPIAAIGNCYTASVFIVLAAALNGLRKKFGAQMTGKRVLVASYGSGNTMLVLSARVAPDAERRVAAWDLDRVFSTYQEAAWDDYAGWLATFHPGDVWTGGESAREARNLYEARMFNASRFAFSERRLDGYRMYRVNAPVAGALRR